MNQRELGAANRDELEVVNRPGSEVANRYTIPYWIRGVVGRYPPTVLHLLRGLHPPEGRSFENHSPYPVNTQKVPSNRGSLGNRCRYARGPERIRRTQLLPGTRLMSRWKEGTMISRLKEQENGFARAEALGRLGKRERICGWSYSCQHSAEHRIYAATDFIIIQGANRTGHKTSADVAPKLLQTFCCLGFVLCPLFFVLWRRCRIPITYRRLNVRGLS